jgi:uncharacterized membrane protein YkgB
MDKIFKYILIILIAIFFTGIMFYGANTIYDYPKNDCWNKYSYAEPVDKNYNNPEYLTKTHELDKNNQICEENFQTLTNNNDQNKQILLGIICIIVLILIFFIKEDFINLGLLSGTIITSFISTIAYYNANSIIGLILLIMIFIGVLIFIVKRINIEK